MTEPDKDQQKLNNRALDKIGLYLSKRDHSEFELRQKLGAKFDSPEIEWAITEAKERKWIGDPEELAARVSTSLANRGKGPLFISQYLYKKGLPVVSLENDDPTSRARELAEHKYGPMSEMSFKDKQKVGRFLVSRGFDNQTVKKVIYEEF